MWRGWFVYEFPILAVAQLGPIASEQAWVQRRYLSRELTRAPRRRRVLYQTSLGRERRRFLLGSLQRMQTEVPCLEFQGFFLMHLPMATMLACQGFRLAISLREPAPVPSRPLAVLCIPMDLIGRPSRRSTLCAIAS